MKPFWLFCADLIRRRYLWVLAASAVATVALAFGIPRLEFSTSQDTIVSSSSQVYQENLRYQQQFGGDPVLVFFEGDIRQLFVPPNSTELAALEDELNESNLYHSVLGPLTILDFARKQIPVAAELSQSALARQQDAAAEIAREEAADAGASEAEQERAAQQARDRVADEFAERVAADAARLAEVGELSLDNPRFVDFLIFDEAGAIRPDFQGIFPDPQHALMVVRLNGNMTIEEQGEGAAAAAELVNSKNFEGLEVLPSGSPILLKEINDTMRESIALMGLLAVAFMVVVLFVVFRARWRLLPLGVVLVGSVWAFGLIGFLGIPLTMVTISGLPILIGLGVDFAIQMHSRFEEEEERTGGAASGLQATLTNLGPALTVAVLAATAGFLALYISRVPMIRDFGSMLAVGIVILCVAGIAIPSSILFWRDSRRGHGPVDTRPSLLEVGQLVRALTSFADRRLLPIVILGLILVVVGLLVDQRIKVQTDPERFVPQDSPVLRDLYRIRDTAGSSSEMGLMVEVDDVTRPDVLEWMADFGERQREEHPVELLRVESIASIAKRVTGAPPTTEDVEAVLSIAPDAIRNSFVSDDQSLAHIVFAIGPISLQERKVLTAQMESDIQNDESKPDDVTVTPAGLAVLGIEAVDALSANRAVMIYAALGAVFAWLLLVYRNLVKAVLPLVPILIAVGSSSAVIYGLGFELNPLTAVSGPLIIATCAQYSLLIMARYFEEREQGRSPRDAISTTSMRIGRAIAASGLTTIGGFGVLAFSGFPLLEGFGVVTALNVSIALFSAIIVLPPLLVWADGEMRLAHVPGDLRPAK